MTWANKKRDWNALVADIQSEIDANMDHIPTDRIKDIQHYLDHDEYSMAFEYLYLEIMERTGAKCTLWDAKITDIALFFNLNDENECMVDGDFWTKLQLFLTQQSALASRNIS
jgi:hypothetical protein